MFLAVFFCIFLVLAAAGVFCFPEVYRYRGAVMCLVICVAILGYIVLNNPAIYRN